MLIHRTRPYFSITRSFTNNKIGNMQKVNYILCFFRVIFFLLEAGFGSIVMVYLQTYKLCILTLLCKSTVLWPSPFGNFGYILFIFLTYYLSFRKKNTRKKTLLEKLSQFQKTAKMIQGQHQINHIVLKENLPRRNQCQHKWNTQKP
jgi:hypothetical protein